MLIDPNGIQPNDRGLAQAVNDIYIRTTPEELYKNASSTLADVTGKIKTEIADVNLLIVGDSTSAGKQTNSATLANNGWVESFAAGLAEMYPTHTVTTRYWADGTPGAWAAVSTTIPGAGSRKINIHVAAVPGRTWQYHLDISRRELMLAVGADAVFTFLGHNEDNGAAQTGNMSHERGKFISMLGDLEQVIELGNPVAGASAYAGSPALIVMSTNNLGGFSAASENRADMYRRIARLRGYGFLDVNQAFRDDGRSIHGELVYDNTHPSAAGYAIISNLVLLAFKQAPQSRPLPSLPAIFNQTGKNLIVDGGLTNLDGSNKPADWTLNNITAAVDSVDFETGSKSLVLTKTADGGGTALVNIPLPAIVKGKTVTVAARIKVPSGQANLVGQLGFNNGAATTQGFVWTQVDQWLWRVFTFRFAPNASQANVRLQVANSVGNLPGQIKLDRIICVLGSLPLEIDNVTA